jgi:hypothetical protein
MTNIKNIRLPKIVASVPYGASALNPLKVFKILA